MITFERVAKRFHNAPLFTDLSFVVPKGKTAVLMGPSGCGKTTLLKCINGLTPVDSGSITVDSQVIVPSPKQFNWQQFRSEIGFVFQQDNLFPHMTVLENIMLGPTQVKKVPIHQAKTLALGWLEKVNLHEAAHRYPGTLSGGEKQRVAIVRALAMGAKILLLDEPTSALDPLMTQEVVATIQTLSQQGITLFIVTHDVPLALQIADQILFLHQGQITHSGPPEHFQNNLTDPFVKRYFQGV